MVNSNNPNMKLWSDLCITDPSKVKPITGKQYKGSSPQPYWLVRRATEQFGPCGQGWGIEIKAQGYQQLDAENIMHWATVIFWYMQDGVRCSTEHMGGTKAMYKTQKGLSYDEDAPKKSVTDAMVKAMSFLGFAGDIFSGLWDDCKYREYAAEHHNQGHQQGGQNQGAQAHQNNQQQNQQSDQEKPLAQRYQDALKAIASAKKPETLDRACQTFAPTQYRDAIQRACNARADQMGWSTPPINQNQNQANSQVRH